MKKILFVIIFLLVMFLCFLGYVGYTENKNDINNELKIIYLNDFNEENNTITLEIHRKKSLLNRSFKCVIKNDNEKYEIDGSDNKCIITVPSGYDYLVSLISNNEEGKSHHILEFIENKREFDLLDEKLYLVANEKLEIKYADKYLVPIDPEYEFISSDESVAKIEDGKIVGVSTGKAYISEKSSEDKIEIIVTDLITLPTMPSAKKLIPCNAYTEEEASLLDELLYYYVDKAGYQTRAGAVAAARFMTLKLEYRIPYFYENGRINDSGVHLADGEGRYYKRGLYLSESKFADIKYTYAGKAIWGCPLKNLENDPKWGYYVGKNMPNGLDCSGFVSWVLVNGGFDPGDVGAGENEGIYQLTDTGEFTALTRELALSGKIKTGDLFNFWGHIAFIIGQDDKNFYVAESLPNLGGVVVRTYSKQTVASHFEFVVFMDSFYEKDGNLEDYWDTY